jgi:hypothetical protein
MAYSFVNLPTSYFSIKTRKYEDYEKIVDKTTEVYALMKK